MASPDYDAARRWLGYAEKLYQHNTDATDFEAGMLAAAIAQVYATLEQARATSATEEAS